MTTDTLRSLLKSINPDMEINDQYILYPLRGDINSTSGRRVRHYFIQNNNTFVSNDTYPASYTETKNEQDFVNLISRDREATT